MPIARIPGRLGTSRRRPAEPRPTPARVRDTVLTVLLVVVLLVAAQMAASAQAGRTSWAVRPADNEHGSDRPNVVYLLEPGDVVEDALVVSNPNATALTLRVYAADGFTSPAGLLDLLPADQPSVDLGTWVTVAFGQITLDPGTSIEVPFVVAVPADARPGDHSGGVVTSVVTGEAAGGVLQDNRLGSRVHVRVAGDLHTAVEAADVEVRYEASLNPFGPGRVRVAYGLANTGNVRTVGIETIEATGPLGTNPRTAAAQLPELVTGSTLRRETLLDGVWPLLRRTVDVEIHAEGVGLGGPDAGAAAPTLVSVRIWTIPWPTLGAIACAILAGVVVGRLRGRDGAEEEQAFPTFAA